MCLQTNKVHHYDEEVPRWIVGKQYAGNDFDSILQGNIEFYHSHRRYFVYVPTATESLKTRYLCFRARVFCKSSGIFSMSIHPATLYEFFWFQKHKEDFIWFPNTPYLIEHLWDRLEKQFTFQYITCSS